VSVSQQNKEPPAVAAFLQCSTVDVKKASTHKAAEKMLNDKSR